MFRRCLLRRRSYSSLTYDARRSISNRKIFEPGDFVLLQSVNSKNEQKLCRGPLQAGKSIFSHKGDVKHDEIIGKRVRDRVTTRTSSGKADTTFRLHEVQLDEYVLFSRRLVTPIYPHDANLIVNLLDLHPDPLHETGEEVKPSIEILEAGTGHGSLTLHLSRAIHAGNGPVPKREAFSDDATHGTALETWKRTRNAVLHSIELKPEVSEHAEKIVQGFRRGLYKHNVDFHVGNVKEWVSSALSDRSNEPFLTHAFLDLPGSQEYLSSVADALVTDGTLIVFNPSITQVAECLRVVKEKKIPLELSTVIELGVNGGSGGREWDVRAVIPRSVLRQEQIARAQAERQAADEAQEPTETSDDESRNEDEPIVEQTTEQESTTEQIASEQSSQTSDANSKDSPWRMVCRPKVGGLIRGGGFLGIFKKKHMASHDTVDAEEF